MSAKVLEAFSVLELEEGSAPEVVKSTYKQIALRTHPDKNPDDPNATAQFQRVSEAYSVILRHFDGDHGDSDNDDEYEFWEEVNLDFYRRMFQEFMMGGSLPHDRHKYYQHPRARGEFLEEYQERLRRNREEQQTSQERRKQEAAHRRERNERDRERERLAAEERQRTKTESKKSQAEAQRKKGEAAARVQLEKVQTERSAAFAAARVGDAEKVKKGVWEDAIDAAGGEVKLGCHKFVHSLPVDPKEALLHIAARSGDVDLVKWLDAHGADPEERDTQGLTAFHVALKNGHIPIVAYFFEAYPPKDEDTKMVYDLPKSKSLLSLALDTCEPELVWMILDKDLTSPEDINNAWSYITSDNGKAAAAKKLGQNPSAKELEKLEDIKKLLMRFGDFTPPTTPEAIPRLKNNGRASSSPQAAQQKSKQKPKYKKRHLSEQHHPTNRPPLQEASSKADPDAQPNSFYASRGRNRGRGFRGRGSSTPATR